MASPTDAASSPEITMVSAVWPDGKSRPGLSANNTPEQVAAYDRFTAQVQANPEWRDRLLGSYLGRAYRDHKAEKAEAEAAAKANPK